MGHLRIRQQVLWQPSLECAQRGKRKATFLSLFKIPLDNILVRNTNILRKLDSSAAASSELEFTARNESGIDRMHLIQETYCSDNENFRRSTGFLLTSLENLLD